MTPRWPPLPRTPAPLRHETYESYLSRLAAANRLSFDDRKGVGRGRAERGSEPEAQPSGRAVRRGNGAVCSWHYPIGMTGMASLRVTLSSLRAGLARLPAPRRRAVEPSSLCLGFRVLPGFRGA